MSKSAAGDADLSWHLINLVGDSFDMTIRQEMLVDHAVTIPLALMARRRTVAGQDRADLDQHRAASAAVVGPLSNLGRSVGRA